MTRSYSPASTEGAASLSASSPGSRSSSASQSKGSFPVKNSQPRPTGGREGPHGLERAGVLVDGDRGELGLDPDPLLGQPVAGQVGEVLVLLHGLEGHVDVVDARVRPAGAGTTAVKCSIFSASGTSNGFTS